MTPEQRAAFLARPEVAAWLARTLAAAPPLSPATLDRLAILLRPDHTAQFPPYRRAA